MDLYDIINIRGPEQDLAPILTTAEHHRRDELITARMFGMQLHVYTTGSRPPTPEEIETMERNYPLNEHAKPVLGIGRPFFEPRDDDIPTDEDQLRDPSDIESEEEPLVEEALQIGGADDINMSDD